MNVSCRGSLTKVNCWEPSHTEAHTHHTVAHTHHTVAHTPHRGTHTHTTQRHTHYTEAHTHHTEAHTPHSGTHTHTGIHTQAQDRLHTTRTCTHILFTVTCFMRDGYQFSLLLSFYQREEQNFVCKWSKLLTTSNIRSSTSCLGAECSSLIGQINSITN